MNVRCQHPSHFGKAPYEPLGILSCRLAAGSSLYPFLHILISEKHTRLYLLRQDIAQLLQCHPKMKSECLAVYRMISIISRKQDCTAKFYYLMYGLT